MKLDLIKKEFDQGNINKLQYIDKMYGQHAILFDYAEYIKSTNISNIEIEDDKVIMKFRDSGLKLICLKDDKRLAQFDTLNFGSYEEDELMMQINMMEPDFNIFDIGANIGWYAITIARKFPNSKIFSFEPIPYIYKLLNENIQLNEIKNIESCNYGLSDAVGTFIFYLDPSLSVNASLANVSNNDKINTVNCSVKKLDDFTTENNIIIDFIKCDVEGAEKLVFTGGIETIKKNKPIIFSEMLRKWTTKFNYHPNDIIKLLKEIGYQCFISRKNKLVQFGYVDENTIETNYFFLHKEKHLEKINRFCIE
jgi:FkbM family methyltransferase